MATTVANFSAIDDTEVDADSPITETLVTRLRDNSYWIDPATTRTTATSNTLVLTPNQTAGTTQWQEVSSLAGIDSTNELQSASGAASPQSIAFTTPADADSISGSVTFLVDDTANDIQGYIPHFHYDISSKTFSYILIDEIGGASAGLSRVTLSASWTTLKTNTGNNFDVRENSDNLEFRALGGANSQSVSGFCGYF